MKIASMRSLCSALAMFATTSAFPALAQTVDAAEEDPAISFKGSVDIVSDYRFRGISLSDFDPAIQPSLTLSHRSGFYVNAWGSNIADYGGADAELDVSVGWTGELGGGTSVDAYAMHYFYPGASGLGYVELGASLSQSIGDGSVSAELSYSPAQNGTFGTDNVYLGLSGSVPVGGTPLKLRGSLGYEDGAFGTDKLDWTVGADYDLGKGFTLGATYVDSYRSGLREGRAGVFANLSFDFSLVSFPRK